MNSKRQRFHLLKCWKSNFEKIIDGRKTYEVRNNDRLFQLNDVLVLQEYIHESQRFNHSNHMDSLIGYTGRVIIVEVIDITDFKNPPLSLFVSSLDGDDKKPDGVVVMGIKQWKDITVISPRIDNPNECNAPAFLKVI